MSLERKPKCEDECAATLRNDIRGGRGCKTIKIEDYAQCDDHHTCRSGHTKHVHGKKTKVTVNNHVQPAEALIRLERGHCKVPGPKVHVNMEPDHVHINQDDIYIDFEQKCPQKVKISCVGDCKPKIDIGPCDVEVCRPDPIVYKKCPRVWMKDECGKWVQVDVTSHKNGSSEHKGKQREHKQKQQEHKQKQASSKKSTRRQ